MAKFHQNLSSIGTSVSREQSEVLHEIGLPGNGLELSVGKDTDKNIGYVAWGHYEGETDSHRIEFSTCGRFVRVYVPMSVQVTVTKTAFV